GLARPEERLEIWELYKRTYLDTYVNEKAGITKEKLTNFLEMDGVYFPKNWQEYLEAPSKERTVYVAKHEGKIVGMVAPVFVNGKHRITALYVAPEVQDLGIGTKLMKKALSHHGKVDIYIGIASYLIGQLQHFYEPFGFRVINPNELKMYPPDPISYCEMVRQAPTD
ncbi:MAG TPA: GNAT family N-acetyltransferase, partial [Candidatus Saccharimonadales bacterium]|nr:GNAT family N-acetyltransferase [Candidatus Saccharimonadales bacterium]